MKLARDGEKLVPIGLNKNSTIMYLHFVFSIELNNNCTICYFSQAKKGYMTESDTDTEVIVKLLKLIYDRDQQSGNEKKLSFPELVEQVILQLVRNPL